jgi:flagellar motor switch/type III secretory pathway protein FliN
MTTQPWHLVLPALDPPTLAFRQALAIHAAVPTGHPFYIGGQEFALAPSEPLPRYSVGARLTGVRGDLRVALECATWLPELSSEVLGAAVPGGEALARWLDWAAMPWLEGLEKALGCSYRVAEAELDVAPLHGSVTLAATRRDGEVAHIAMQGGVLDALAGRIPAVTHGRMAPWMRVPVTVLFRVRGISLPRIERLIAGAVLRLYPHDLHIRFGKRPGNYDMQAEWMDDDDLGVARVAGGAASQAFSPDGTDAQALASLDDLTFDIDVVLETRSLSMDEARNVCKGAIIELKRPLDGRQVALVSNGKTFARGSLVTVGDRLAVMIDEYKSPRG